MWPTLTLFVLILAAAGTANWHSHPRTGKQYIDLDLPVTPGIDPQTLCHDIGAFLPEPKNEKENKFLASLSSRPIRLGMRKKADVWRWDSDGSLVNWLSWSAPGQGLCVYTANGQRGDHSGWLAVNCSRDVGVTTVVCEKRCDDVKVDRNCSNDCHCRTSADHCDVINGTCVAGCHLNWTGVDCPPYLGRIEKSADTKRSTWNGLMVFQIVIGATAGLLMFVGVTINISILYSRKRFKKNQNPVEDDEEISYQDESTRNNSLDDDPGVARHESTRNNSLDDDPGVARDESTRNNSLNDDPGVARDESTRNNSLDDDPGVARDESTRNRLNDDPGVAKDESTRNSLNDDPGITRDIRAVTPTSSPSDADDEAEVTEKNSQVDVRKVYSRDW